MKCAKDKSECVHSLCGATKAILCSDGRCVKTQLECIRNRKVYCPIDLPYKCSSGVCKKHRYQCDISN